VEASSAHSGNSCGWVDGTLSVACSPSADAGGGRFISKLVSASFCAVLESAAARRRCVTARSPLTLLSECTGCGNFSSCLTSSRRSTQLTLVRGDSRSASGLIDTTGGEDSGTGVSDSLRGGDRVVAACGSRCVLLIAVRMLVALSTGELVRVCEAEDAAEVAAESDLPAAAAALGPSMVEVRDKDGSTGCGGSAAEGNGLLLREGEGGPVEEEGGGAPDAAK